MSDRSVADLSAPEAGEVMQEDFARTLLEAEKLSSEGRFDIARERLLSALGGHADEPELHFALADVSYQCNLLGEARSYYESGLRLRPTDCDARLNLARLYIVAGDLAHAAYEVNQADGNCPGDARVPHLLGIVNDAVGNHEQAGELLKRATELDPEDLDVLMDLGDHLRSVGHDPAGAEAAFGRVLAQRIDHVGGHAALADLYLEQRRVDEAFGVVNWLIRRVPKEPNTWARLALAEELSDRHAEAADAWRRASDLRPDDPSSWLRLAQAAYQSYDEEGALEALDRALALDDELASAYLLRATIGFEQQENDKAFRDLRQVLYLDLALAIRDCPRALIEAFISEADDGDDWRGVFYERYT